MAQGQINRGSLLGDAIYEYTKRADVKTIVEFGTYNGLGSTRCILDGIRDSGKTDFLFYSIEAYESMYRVAKENNPTLPLGAEIIYGRIVEVDELNWFDKEKLNDDQKKWLRDDIVNYNMCPYIMEKIPSRIDLLILDGGEFSSYVEFHKLIDRSKILVLDDTFARETMKFNLIRKSILETGYRYKVIEDRCNDRNGFMIVENKNFNG
jgi:hypothetical protein